MIEETTNPEIHSDENSEEKFFPRKPWLAALLNYFIPGLGYFYIGQIKLGIAWAIANPLMYIAIVWISMSLPRLFNVFFLLTAISAITLFRVIDAYKETKKIKDYVLTKANKLKYYIIFVVAYLIFYSVADTFSGYGYYKIPTVSMENSLFVGDFLFAKMNKSHERNEIAIYYPANSFETKEDAVYVKRIIGLPGDTIKISNKLVYINGELEKERDTFIYDRINRPPDFPNPRIYPKGAPWNEDNYGPLYIPKAKDIIKLDTTNIKYWKQFIFRENDVETKDAAILENYISSILKDGIYIVKNNYYFLMGDNRNNSLDSRFTGLVKEEDILGKPEFILFNFTYPERVGLIIN